MSGSVEDRLEAEVNVEVVCYAGDKGDERPVRFDWLVRITLWKNGSTSGMGRTTSFLKCARMTAIYTSCSADICARRRMELGIFP